MDLDDIRRHAMAAREISHSDAGISAQLRIPTRHEVQLAMARSGGRSDPAAMLVVERSLLESAVVGWSGVRLRHVLPAHEGDELLPFEAGAVATVLDAQPDWALAWGLALFRAMKARTDTQEAAEKN